MKTIHKLSPLQIAKIAAGEVIEKPAFAVKELVENSIDAKATHIQISIEDGGLKKIQVIDDGIGMNEADLKDSFKLHTTSKISPDDDLIAIGSLGFRGEALASIAAISRLTIQSRQTNMLAGIKLEIESGKLISSAPIGMPTGTQIEVRDLFYSLPARKKFIESPLKEYRLILDWMIKIALANSTIRFTFSHNQKIIFDTSKNQTLHQRLLFFLRDPHLEKLVPLRYEDSYINIQGFTSLPQHSTVSTSKQFLFINKRPVEDKLIKTAIKESYGNLIDSNKYPIYILDITLPKELVDVNVHPRKEQVNYHNKQYVFDQVQKAIYQVLQLKKYPEAIKEQSIVDSFAGQLLKKDTELFLLEKKINKEIQILQIFDLFLVFQAQKELFIVDQHAAHERILYEQFKQLFQEKKHKKYKLPKKIKLNLSIQESEIVSQNISTLKQFGIKVQRNKSEFQITEVPEILKDRNFADIFPELVEQINQDKKISFDIQTDKMLKYLACRGAIKQGDKLNNIESQELISKLFQTPNYQSCPHGRPTFIKTPLTELYKQFKRI
jgi:DNA mismatch repair protein MutL